ncbi:MAG: ScpA family protein [Thiomicrospira sp.]
MSDALQLSFPFAIVQGTVLNEAPQGLYIPPNALKVMLAEFEGPLDLLSYLIRLNKFDIRDIPVFEVAKQYQAYLAMMEQLDIELAGEYLFMAAWLTEIKSRLLLPKAPNQENDGDEEDPRAELVEKLLEYEAYQHAAKWLGELDIVGRDIWPICLCVPPAPGLQPTLNAAQLWQALHQVLQRSRQRKAHQVRQEVFDIGDKINLILQRLGDTPLFLWQLVSCHEGRLGLVVTFMAILELTYRRQIMLMQTDAFADIAICRPDYAFE